MVCKYRAPENVENRAKPEELTRAVKRVSQDMQAFKYLMIVLVFFFLSDAVVCEFCFFVSLKTLLSSQLALSVYLSVVTRCLAFAAETFHFCFPQSPGTYEID